MWESQVKSPGIRQEVGDVRPQHLVIAINTQVYNSTIFTDACPTQPCRAAIAGVNLVGLGHP